MAFNSDNLHIVVHAISGGAFRLASYETTDSPDVVTAEGYFASAPGYGLKLNTLVAVIDPSAASEIYTVRIVSIDSAGDATAAIDSGATATEFDTVALVEAARILASIDAIRTRGFYTAGDEGGALYKRVGSEPSHLGKIQSLDGAWWEIVNRGRELTDVMLGAVGGGSDETEIVSDLFVLGGGVITQALTVGDIDIENKVEVWFDGDGKLSLLPSAQTAVGSALLWIRVLPDAAGSIFHDWNQDGNWDAIFGSQAGLKRALRVGATDVQFRGRTRISNIVGGAFHAGNILVDDDYDQPERLYLESFYSSRFIQTNQIQKVVDGVIGDLVATGYDNSGIVAIPQACFTIRANENTKFGNIVTPNILGDEDGGSTYIQATQIFSNEDCSFGDLTIPYSEGADHRIMGTSIVSNRSCRFGFITAHGCHIAVEDLGNNDCHFAGGLLDGHYVVRDADGGAAESIIGWYMKGPRFVTEDATEVGLRHKAGAIGNTYGPVRAIRGGLGVKVETERATLVQWHCIGNLNDGFRLLENDEVHASYAVTRGSRVSVQMIGCRAKFNGRLGLDLRQTEDLVCDGCEFNDNGWDDSLSVTQRSGIGATAISSGWRNLRPTFRNCDLSNRNTWSEAASVSLEPTTTDANDRAVISMVLPQRELDYGAYILIADAGGVGTDYQGRVIERDGDDFTLQFDAAKTFTPATVNLTGTWKRHATEELQLVETSSAGAAETEVTGRFWLRKDSTSEYAHVDKVINNNTIQVAEMFATVDINGDGGAGHTLKKVVYDGEGVPFQQHGAQFSGTMIEDGLFEDCEAVDNETADIGTTPTLLRSGTRYRRSQRVTLSTDGAVTTIMAIPDGWVVGSWRAIVVEEITGTDGTWGLKYAAGLTDVLVSGLALTVGTQTRGSVGYGQPAVPSTVFQVLVDGGADNIPTAGVIKVELELYSSLPAEY